MTATFQRINGTTIQLINGHARMRAALDVFGTATVTDIKTGEVLEVHESNGQVVVFKDAHASAAKTLAAIAIKYAARHPT